MSMASILYRPVGVMRLAAAFAVLLAVAGCGQTTQNQSSNPAEAKERSRSLARAYLANMKDVTVAFESMNAAGNKLVSAGLKNVVVDAIRKQGYNVVESGSPNLAIVSTSQDNFLSGTANSYWHYGTIESVSVTFSRRESGAVFKNTWSGPTFTGKETRPFPGIRVKHLDNVRSTFINPDKGTVWGFGVEITDASTDPAVQAADRYAFRTHNWAAQIDDRAAIDTIRRAFERLPPLGIDDPHMDGVTNEFM